MRTVRRWVTGVAILGCATFGATTAPAAVVVLDSFEANEGHFNQEPEFSTTTASIVLDSPGVGPSTAVRVTTQFHAGAASQELALVDDTAGNAPDGSAWRLRHVSGSGTPANNTNLDNTATSYVGYWLKTSTPNLRAAILIDDGAGLERATRTPINSDGEWHLYQWKLSAAAAWDSFVGGTGALESALVTIDALYLDATAAGDATVYIDDVSFSPDGPIPAPEPATLTLLTLAATAALTRRPRRRQPTTND